MALNIEQTGSQGYIAFKPEANIGTVAGTPDLYSILESETLTTEPGHVKMKGIFANLADTYTVLPGMRKHIGDIEVPADPNIATVLYYMHLPVSSTISFYTFTVTSANATINATYTNNGVTFTVVSTIVTATTLLMTAPGGAPTATGTLTKATGTGDATITFSAALNTSNNWNFLATVGNPLTKSHTVDISMGETVKRFYGVMASKITPAWKDNLMTLKASVSALGSFQGATIATATYSNPSTTVVLDTTYDPNPTTGLVAGDSIKLYLPGTYTPTTTTITSITNGTTLVLTGDFHTYGSNRSVLYIAAQTSPVLSLLPNLLWTNTQFCFGATASAALSAPQIRGEEGSTWETVYNFSKDAGEQRSGGNDPQSLPRTTFDNDLTFKKFFKYPDDIQNMQLLTKGACQVRHFSYSGGATYELRVTLNHIVTSNPLPNLKPKEIEYSTIKYDTQYDQTDGQQGSVLTICGLNTIS